MKAKGQLKEYEVLSRKLPTEKEPQTPLYKMRIFARDNIVAKSCFLVFLASIEKVQKKTTGEIVSLKQVYETSPTKIKKFGIWLRYDSRSGTHIMYREYRDLKVGGDMGARHRARAHSIPASKTRRVHVKQYHNSTIKFPLVQRIHHKSNRKIFSYRKPRTYFR
ncbi:large ribosomal subunit protein eL20-like [Eurosta solidaginis]|uniref:large ribosomal subunit protein eL20-like n=1 Tax=Eurosta solidaginis TaxID=178769 RepID=UPI003530D519